MAFLKGRFKRPKVSKRDTSISSTEAPISHKSSHHYLLVDGRNTNNDCSGCGMWPEDCTCAATRP